MLLVNMLEIDRGAFICDMAETYHVFDYKALPVDLLVTLASGLRENSRIRCKMANLPISMDTFFIAGIHDLVSLLWWGQTTAGRENRNRPEALLPHLLGKHEDEKKLETYLSGDDFKAAWNALGGK